MPHGRWNTRMGMLNRRTLYMFIIWLLIVPPGIYYLYINHSPQEINWYHVLLFTLFGVLMVYFSVYRNGNPVFLVKWITLPAFLVYGLFVEVTVMQISSIAMLFAYKSPVPMLVRYFFNSTLYFILSFVSAITFHLIGGEVGMLEFWPVIIAVLGYQVTYTVLNDLLLRLYAFYSKNRSPYFFNDIEWDYGIAFLILPYSLILYYLIRYIGNGAFILLGVPFFLLIFIIRLYSNSEKINGSLQQVRETGHSLSHSFTEEKVLDQFTEKSSELFNAEFAYLFDHKEGWLELIRSYEKNQFIDHSLSHVLIGEGIAAAVLLNNEPVIYSKQEEWIDIVRQQQHQSYDNLQSVLCMPISRNQKVEGVVFLASKRKNAFQDYQLKTLKILCSYFTLSVERARYVEEAVRKSERCDLTKLYNYIYLEERLESEIDNLTAGVINELSVLILDLDHFKKVNDTYGHQSGNAILAEFARILENIVPEGGIVARYGGEEFVYLLPNTSKEEAMHFAEKVRRKIERHIFQITPDLGDFSSLIDVQITVSIGVSTAFEDADDAKFLLRNADRSLYIGAKQAGRNRVASYIK